MLELETMIKDRFEDAAKLSESGELERMRDRIETLENAVSHLMAFVATRMRLTEEEIENENGLMDF